MSSIAFNSLIDSIAIFAKSVNDNNSQTEEAFNILLIDVLKNPVYKVIWDAFPEKYSKIKEDNKNKQPNEIIDMIMKELIKDTLIHLVEKMFAK